MTPLPVGWSWVTLDDLQADEPAAITDGPFGSHLTSAHYRDSGPRVVRLQNIGDGVFHDARAHIASDHFAQLRRHEVKPGDLLVASLGERLPRACLAPATLGPAIVKADCIRVRLHDRVESRWVLYAMQTSAMRAYAADQLHGVGRPRLGLKVIRSLPIPLPPLDEQRRIVDVLEDHLSRLDVGRSTMRISRARLAALRVARLRSWHEQAVAAGGTPTALGDVVDTALGKMLDAKANRGESTPYLRNVNVRWGTVDLRDVRTVPLADAEQARFSLARGDLLVCEGGEPGRCAIWQSNAPMAYQKALHRLRVRDGAVTTAPYVALMLEEFVRSGRAEGLFTGTTIKHLPQKRLRSIPIPLPRLEVQHQLIEEAALFHTDVERFDATLATTQRREAGLRRALLDAAFSGQL